MDSILNILFTSPKNTELVPPGNLVSSNRELPAVQAEFRKGGGGLVAKCPTFATPGTVACQVPLSIGFSRKEHWSGLLFPSPWDLPDPGIEPWSPALQVESLPTEL